MADPMEELRGALELDAQGLIVTRPVLGWTTVPVAGMSVLLRIHYAEKPEELGTEGHGLQVVMTPPQALELAESLASQARRFLEPRDPREGN